MGTLPAESSSGIVLRLERPGAEVNPVGSGKWETAADGMYLKEGDEVRTDGAGRATIRFFELGEARLQENSSVVIETAKEGADQPTTALIKLKLISGRVWSRVLRLLDLDSSFSVRTDMVVATVRGTAFEMAEEEGGTTVRVFESAVSVEADGAEEVMVSEGFKISREKSGSWKPVESFGAEEEVSEWFEENLKADEKFMKDVKEAVAKRLSVRPASRPDHSLFGLARASERAHLALSGKNKDKMFGRYLEYRIHGIKSLMDDGKSGLAFQALSELDQDIAKRVKEKKGTDAVKHMRRAEAKVRVLFEGVGPDSGQYRLKQRIEDVAQKMFLTDPSSEFYERVSSADSRLREVADLLKAGKLEEIKATLEAAKQGLSNVDRDLEGVKDMDPKRLRALRGKLKALRLREEAFSARLKNDLFIPEIPEATTSTATVKPQLVPITQPNVETTSSVGTVLPKPPTEPPFESISLLAFPNPVEVFKLSKLRVIGKRADGSSADITPRAMFVIIGDLGIISGAVYSAARPGSVVIEAVVFDNGRKMTAKTPMNVIVPPAIIEGGTTTVATTTRQ